MRFKGDTMLKTIIENRDFMELSKKHVKDTIDFLIDKKVEFSVVANIKAMEFEPDLPNDIKKNLNSFSLFSLAGYTLQTTFVNDDFLCFEAGFGKDNFGSFVKLPLFSIFQIILDDNIININISATVDSFHKNLKKNSFNVFKNNPNNKDLVN